MSCSWSSIINQLLQVAEDISIGRPPNWCISRAFKSTPFAYALASPVRDRRQVGTPLSVPTGKHEILWLEDFPRCSLYENPRSDQPLFLPLGKQVSLYEEFNERSFRKQWSFKSSNGFSLGEYRRRSILFPPLREQNLQKRTPLVVPSVSQKNF